jgi:hypothetical protein
MLRDFIDISFSPLEHEQPYSVFVYEAGAIADIQLYADLHEVATYCQQRGLPVVLSSPEIQADLLAHGVTTQPFDTRTAGTEI